MRKYWKFGNVLIRKVGRKKNLKFSLMEEFYSPIDHGSADSLPYFILYPDRHYNLNKDLGDLRDNHS